MSTAAERSAAPAAAIDPPETPDVALIRCEHERAALARRGQPTGLLFETVDRQNT